MGRILVLGASPNPSRFSNKAVSSLIYHNYDVVAVGFRKGIIDGLKILTGMPHIGNVHTILLYMGPFRQKEFYNYILDLKPARIIFNPGTENSELAQIAENKNITVINNCALVMIDSGTF
jgi:predicted CoA-binding protein